MKVVFLDIDGVLNSHRSLLAAPKHCPNDFSPYGMKKFDPVALGLLRVLCYRAGLVVVVSSTWRKGRTAIELAQGLQLPVVDVTPVLDTLRGVEIQDWLTHHPEVTQYAIIDDDSDMLDSQLPFFVHTKHTDGLSWDNYIALCNIFGVDETGKPGQTSQY